MNELTEQKYRQLKQEMETAKSEADRAQGQLDQLMTRLKEDFGCATLKEAKAKLEELEKEKATAEKAFEKALRAYEMEWKG